MPRGGTRLPYGLGRGSTSHVAGDDYGSAPGGFPMRRMMRDGRLAGFEVQFQGDWMHYEEFMNPIFQESWVQPWQAGQREESLAGLRESYPGHPGLGYGGFGGGGR